MNPSVYLDLEVRNGASTGEARWSSLPVVTRLMSILHGVFRTYPGRFALAFPRMRAGEAYHPGHIVRVFAEKREDLDFLVSDLDSNPRIAGYVRIGYARPVPAEFPGPWKEYRRFRIPGRGSRLERCRAYRIQAGDTLPYFKLGSRSTGQTFSIRIECRDGAPSARCQPDSYGLSVATRQFALPQLP
jgi:hypothetical protein